MEQCDVPQGILRVADGVDKARLIDRRTVPLSCRLRQGLWSQIVHGDTRGVGRRKLVTRIDHCLCYLKVGCHYSDGPRVTLEGGGGWLGVRRGDPPLPTQP